jgi:asparagine synthase (glutamine-hydrolysing)
VCGIIGYWDERGAEVAIARKMANALQHRGPDDTGVWISTDHKLALGHQRLSIIDLSCAGHQPMKSQCGRYTLVYNGEIYNHQDLRNALQKETGQVVWQGHSDTETLLAGLRHWGLKTTLKRANGMFAFALWDDVERTLILARDRLGEKPLYYGHSGATFFFSSELKGLMQHPNWAGEVNRDALALYMRHNYVPAPFSIYTGISKLPPASYVVVANFGQSVSPPQTYWDFDKIAAAGRTDSNFLPDLAIDELEHLLGDAIARRMTADVPLGAFLSGGIDSSLITALMQTHSTQPVQTFTIGFGEGAHNEAPHAKAIAGHLGTDHTELYVSPADALAVIPQLPTIWDEPFADSSQIPTYLVSAMARKSVKVCLSGDGGDELFYGYDRYASTYRSWRVLKKLPLPARRLLAMMMRKAPGASLERLLRLLPEQMQIPHLADRLPKLAKLVTQKQGELYYQWAMSHWKDPASLVLGSEEPNTRFHARAQLAQLQSLREQMMYLDSQTYLPDDILTKVDRASMAVGLEVRVPLLDHRVVEFAWRLPHSFKERRGQGKWILRELLARHVPRRLFERQKMGFGVPIEHWLRGPLRDWAEDLLSEQKLRDQGYFAPAPIRKMWQEHLAGTRRWHYYLWDVLMFQAWLGEHPTA